MGTLKGVLTILLLAAMTLTTGQSAYAAGKEIGTPQFIGGFLIDPRARGIKVNVTLIIHYQNISIEDTNGDDATDIAGCDINNEFEADMVFFVTMERRKARFFFSGADATRICATNDVEQGTIIGPFLAEKLTTVLGRSITVDKVKVKSATDLVDLSAGPPDAPPFFAALELVLVVPKRPGENDD